VENLLFPEYARFNIHFAVNEMVIAFSDRSRRQEEITQDNWHEVLLDREVRFGRSDPNSDPCGYRTEMVFQLAELHLGQTGLAERLTSKHGRIFIRPKETDLLALLEAGEIDYLPIYRSVALQHGLRFVELAPEVNLGDPAQVSQYRSARVTVTGKTPGSSLTLVGEPIVYSMTIPTSSAKLLEVLLGGCRALNQRRLSGVVWPLFRRILDPYHQYEPANPPKNDLKRPSEIHPPSMPYTLLEGVVR